MRSPRAVAHALRAPGQLGLGRAYVSVGTELVARQNQVSLDDLVSHPEQHDPQGGVGLGLVADAGTLISVYFAGQRTLRSTVANDRISITPFPGNTDPPPVTATASPSFQMLNRTIREIYPDVIVAPGLMVAATDGNHGRAVAWMARRAGQRHRGGAAPARFHWLAAGDALHAALAGLDPRQQRPAHELPHLPDQAGRALS